MVLEHMVQDHMVLEHKLVPKSQVGLPGPGFNEIVCQERYTFLQSPKTEVF